MYLGQNIYFLFYGPKIIRVFDSKCFCRVYQSKLQAITVFTMVLAFNHIWYFVALFELHQIHHLAQWPTWQNLTVYISMYVLLNFSYWFYLLLHYFQYGTLKMLQKLEKKLVESRSKFKMKHVLVQIKTLALVNHRANQLLSIPAILYLTMSMFALTLNLSIVLVCQSKMAMLLHAVITFLYAIYLINLNRKIMQTLKHIFRHIHRHYQSKESKTLTFLTNTLPAKNKMLRMKQLHHSTVLCGKCERQHRFKMETMQRRQFDLDEMEVLYSEYFSIQVFYLAKINFKFLLESTLFIFSIIIIFLQTIEKLN